MARVVDEACDELTSRDRVTRVADGAGGESSGSDAGRSSVYHFSREQIQENINPRMPSTPEKPVAEEATPIDCSVMTKLSPSVTVSVYSSPEKEPEP